ALLFPLWAAPASPGDRVVVNTTAVDLGLGTGGHDIVVWNLAHASHEAPSGGHVMKLRYTPGQSDVLAVEAPESPHHDVMATSASLADVPVVAASLHSQLLPVVAVLHDRLPQARVVYVMTDGGALPAGLSRTLRTLRELGWLAGTVTTGHAVGGDLEAVTLHSGLLAARAVLRADVVVAGMGPGVVGTSTPFGTTGLDLAAVVNATLALDGRPVVALRMSEGDPRDRHRGVSHHVRTALTRLVHRPEAVGVPVPSDAVAAARAALPGFAVAERPDGGVLGLLAGLPAAHMGRSPDEDPLFFRCAGAAATHAADLVG
ncbi:MAG TPA: DUF3866 family protein, partial [Actinomycetota bacterium]|nr:DUF3866 family protein [Actinomycetota bacterium]